jgi:LysR family transcriptional regulator, nod-box dependent transcriptional activator
MELTPLGQSLVDPVHDVLANLEHLLNIAPAFNSRTDSRSFTIAASDYVTLVLLRPLLALLYREAPGVTVSVVPVNLATPMAVERAQIDLAIIPRGVLTISVPHIRRRELFTEHYVPAVWSRNREVGDTLDRDAIQRLPYVRYYQESSGPALIDIQLAALELTPRTALTTVSFALVPSLLPETASFSFVHERLLGKPYLRSDLRRLNTPIALDPIVQYMYWHPVMDRDPAHRWLRERIAALAGKI